MTTYLVTGKHRYRGYDPGSTFIGELEPSIEARAIGRGSIEIVDRGPIQLDPTRAALPRGWATDGPPKGATQ